MGTSAVDCNDITLYITYELQEAYYRVGCVWHLTFIYRVTLKNSGTVFIIYEQRLPEVRFQLWCEFLNVISFLHNVGQEILPTLQHNKLKNLINIYTILYEKKKQKNEECGEIAALLWSDFIVKERNKSSERD